MSAARRASVPLRRAVKAAKTVNSKARRRATKVAINRVRRQACGATGRKAQTMSAARRASGPRHRATRARKVASLDPRHSG